MSRETLLDEAIAKAKEAGDWQLVDWLRMARGGESAARWYTKKLRELGDENAKLRELAGALLTSHEKMCTQRGHCFGCTFFYEEVKACPYVKISQTLRELGVEVDR